MGKAPDKRNIIRMYRLLALVTPKSPKAAKLQLVDPPGGGFRQRQALNHLCYLRSRLVCNQHLLMIILLGLLLCANAKAA